MKGLRFVAHRIGIRLVVSLALSSMAPMAMAQPLSIGSYQKVREVRVTRTIYEYVYRAALANNGTAIDGANATATSRSSATTIVEGALSFDALSGGAAATSIDTFAFRHDRAVPFNFANIVWDVQPLPPSPPGSFELLLPAASISTFAASQFILVVQVQRGSGFVGSIEIGLSSPPAGVSAQALTLSAGATRASLLVTVSAGMSPGVVPLTIEAATDSVAHSAQITLTVAPPQPRAQDLIRQALASGAIDLPTSLLYRAYALTSDPRLPASMRGSGSDLEDSGLFHEIRNAIPTLPEPVRTQLLPFTLRPTDPEGWYRKMIVALGLDNGAASAARATAISTAADGSAPELAEHCGQSTDGWISRRSELFGFRVWAWCAPDSSADTGPEDDIARTIDVMETAWPFEVGIMDKQPAADDAPIDPATGRVETDLDVYVLFPAALLERRGQAQETLSAQQVNGWVSPVGTDAGYIVLHSAVVQSRQLRITGPHELFHVLQNAYNSQLFVQPLPGFGGIVDSVTAPWWYIEASATWAATHVARRAGWPERSDEYLRFGGLAQVSGATEADATFQARGSLVSLNTPGGLRPYAAFIWPYFMEQVTDFTRPGEAVWNQVVGLTTTTEADAALDRALSFEEHFRTFAMRGYNDALLPGDALPAAERFVGLDPGDAGFSFSDGVPPLIEVVGLGAGIDRSISIKTAGLAAKYLSFTVADEGVLRVDIDLAAIDDEEVLDADAFVKIAGRDWKRERLDGVRRRTFCMNHPEEKLEEYILIVSNHRVAPPLAVPSDVNLTVKTTGTACGLVGTVTFTGHATQRMLGQTTSEQKGSISVTGLEFELISNVGGKQVYRPVAGEVTWHSSWFSASLNNNGTVADTCLACGI